MWLRRLDYRLSMECSNGCEIDAKLRTFMRWCREREEIERWVKVEKSVL
ncbi:5803_t:CDS:2 [Gigaspora margarita]|uniref:5803_t:CDS:1 n=1 Tax=Gigaspora margarita TaxID=4874 RepID=A0ABN7UCC1_GIGMA|nr:5803_t:CDS:2 [Gigaspora margarita]